MNEIKKTYKNYVGGKYVRSESGKTFRIELKNQFYEVQIIWIWSLVRVSIWINYTSPNGCESWH